jgi:AcrR family transcriptional regulator
MTEKNKGGRPPHEPTEATRKQVESMAGFGITAADIAKTLGISETTLRKHYRDEIDLGTIKANSAVAQSLYKKALGDGASSVTAAIFWAKTRMGWKETTINEHTGKDGAAHVTRIEIVAVEPVLVARQKDEQHVTH